MSLRCLYKSTRIFFAFFLLFSFFLQAEPTCSKEDPIFKNPVEIAALRFPKVKVEDLDNYALSYSSQYVSSNAQILADMINTVIVATYGGSTKATPLPGYEVVDSLYLDEKNDENRLFGLILLDKESKNLVIVFRGTQTKYEWMLDQQVCQTKWNGGRVASGFYQAFLSNQEKIQKALKLHKKVPNIWIAGHSIGAAVATITAYDILLESREKNQTLSCYTFGSPRVLNLQLASQFKKAMEDDNLVSFRVVNIADSVPSVPPASTTEPFYEHVGHPIFYQFNGETAADNHAFYLKELLSGKDVPICPWKPKKD